MRRIALVMMALLELGCARGRWRSQPAEAPLSRAEVGSWNVTLAARIECPDPSLLVEARALREALAPALAARGFRLVEHEPYNHDLEVRVRLERGAGGSLFAAALLTTDGFYVADAEEPVAASGLRDPEALQQIASSLASFLAQSDGLASFVRNSGVPSQIQFTN